MFLKFYINEVNQPHYFTGFGATSHGSPKESADLFIKCLKKKNFSEFSSNFVRPELTEKNLKEDYKKLFKCNAFEVGKVISEDNKLIGFNLKFKEQL